MRGTKSSATPFRYDASLASHFSFFMGDLNFRTKLPDCEAGSPEHIQACHNLVAERNWVKLNKHDELAKALRDKECLVGWRTPYCNFDPTFKVARQDGYEYNVKRSPSYTDRILFKTGDQLEPSLEVLAYEPIRGFTSSDHKPIRGAYSIKLNEELGIEEEKSEEKSCKENFHLFVSSIECEINQETYNRDRQTSDAKVEPPCPFVSLVSTPSEALLSDDNKKGSQWKSFGLGKIKKMTKKLAYDDDLNAKKKSSSSASKWPGTSVLVSTFDPKWSGEEIHFQVRTLEDDGGQIDLSGALLHISLFDFKGTEAKLLGSFSLNLARLIKISKEKLPSPLLARTNETEEVSNGTGWSYSPEKTPSAALLDAANKDAPSPVKTISKSMLERQSKDENKPEKRPIRGMLAREVSQTRLMAKPSPEFCDIMNEASDDKESSDGRVDASEKCSDLKIVSMKIDELLTESGIEIGRITCSIDAWWMAVKDS